MKEVLSLFIFILLLNLVLSGCIEGTLEPEIIPTSGKIAFNTVRDGNSEIYIMNSDGSHQINLTNNESTDESPTFSPDGSKIAFKSGRDGNYEIYLMDINGSNQVNLTNTLGDDINPVFQPQ